MLGLRRLPRPPNSRDEVIEETRLIGGIELNEENGNFIFESFEDLQNGPALFSSVNNQRPIDYDHSFDKSA